MSKGKKVRINRGRFTIFLLGVLIVLTIVVCHVYRVEETEVIGINYVQNPVCRTSLSDVISVKPAKGRFVELQKKDVDTDRFETIESYQLPDSEEGAKLRVCYPDNWDDDISSEWRIVIPRKGITRAFESKTITVFPRNRGMVPGLTSKAAVIMDYKTGNVIYGKNMDERLPNASTTKMMTALVSMKNVNPDKKVRLSKKAINAPDGLMYKKKGDIFYMRDLWNAMLIRSCNDAAVAVAEGTCGDVDVFVKKMNKEAMKLGCKNTHFVNPHGWDSWGHYSSARDLAKIDRAAMAIEEYRRIIKRKVYTFRAVNKKKRFNIFHTSNDLIKTEFSGHLGGKTGTTINAGMCFCGVWKYRGKKYITVVLGSQNRWKDTKRLYRYIKNYA